MTQVLMTGGTGFFGRSLLRFLAAQGTGSGSLSQLVVLARNPEGFLKAYPEFRTLPWLAFHTGDVMRPETLPQGRDFTACLHAATDSTNGPAMSAVIRFDQIVAGTRNMLDWAVANRVPRFLLTSSGGVYGTQPEAMALIPETWQGIPDPLKPANAYSIGKRVAEHLCSLYAEQHGIQAVVARCFAFIGQDLPLDVHFAIGNFIRDALWADEIVINGDGTSLRSYLDQRDLARWLLALLHEGKAGEAYNVGSDHVISIADLAHMVRDLVSPGKPVRILGKPVDNAERNRYIPDISKIGRDLGLRPGFSLEQSILDTAAAARSRGNSGQAL